ncbi:metal-dependent hydrolase family protein [Flavobacterium succinicans]|uniref:5-methylthioadenosine/S-adenosylhomocysteine deaminase n=1 Tax=Flavobacterium succinicans TaxID=29536 RepID=A0A199XUB7_9FLAO|nr:amidohydrolase family protein [Flavobacterium succinicans]OAZ05358.1 5-methylthioadenosine/S-adenosylhomocysteine deaminase [Flavobacterium succinicans]
MTNKIRQVSFLLVITLMINTVCSAQTPAPTKILINNVNIFNGKDNKTVNGNILIEGSLIKQISTSPIAVDKSGSTQIIDGKGKYVIPGLIDAHAHLMMESLSGAQMATSDFAYMNLFAAKAAEKQLLRGFTTVRDLGGGALSLAKAIDHGLYAGPRVFASGAFISQTGGHGDFGMPTDVPKRIGDMTYTERNGMNAVADGVDQVLLRSRENLRQGATQLKLAAGGGVASNYDGLDVAQYSLEELKAAVLAAENWGTYVTVHAYTPKAVQTAIAAGVKCIEHGQLLDEATVKIMAEKGIWWDLQPFLNDDDAIYFPPGSENEKKYLEMTNGTDITYKLAKKHNVKLAWGTDCLFDAGLAKKQGKQLAKVTRWLSNFEVLKMATSSNAELLSLSGKRNPYKAGKLGEISEGAYADLIIVNGNPLQDIQLIVNPDENFQLIMKDGKVYKNTLAN